MVHASLAGGLAGRACSACRRTGRWAVQRLQADWSVERAALTGGLVDRACSACRRTGRSNERRLQADWSVEGAALAVRLIGRKCRRACRWTGQSSIPGLAGGLVWRPVDWSVQHTGAGACRRAGLATVKPALLADCSVVRASLAGGGGWCGPVARAALAGGLVDRPCSACRQAGRSSVQCLQAGWSVEHASFAGGLIGRASSAYRRTGRSSVQRLHPDWSVESAAALAGGLVSPAYRRLQADWSVESTAALAGGLVNPTYRRLQAGWSVDRPALQAE